MSDRGYDAPVDLAAFLTARLDEDEAVARAVTSRQPADEWDAVGARGEDDIALSYWGVSRIARAEQTPAARDIAIHIARHDPARVLAEVEAKRAIIDEHGRRVSEFWPDGTTCSRCVKLMSGWREDWSVQEYPCRTLRFLASVYAEHPDYREEWKP